MKIVTVIVLYNPSPKFFSNYYRYSEFSSMVLFVDNSTNHFDYHRLIESVPNSRYVSLNGNKGIAKALSLGMETAIREKADYVLTMDQDSVFPFDRFKEIEAIINDNKDYGILGLNFNSDNTDVSIKDVRWWLTSGNFINVQKYLKLDQGFNPDLFIDAVDADICHSFHSKGFKIGYIQGISLIHEMGKPNKVVIGPFKFTTLNYAPIRYYYIFRNNFYLYLKDKKFFRKDYFNVMVKMKFKIKHFEKNWAMNKKAIRYGIDDAKKGLLGKCSHSDIQ